MSRLEAEECNGVLQQAHDDLPRYRYAAVLRGVKPLIVHGTCRQLVLDEIPVYLLENPGFEALEPGGNHDLHICEEEHRLQFHQYKSNRG